MRELLVVDLGRREYGEVLSFQRELCRARMENDAGTDVMLLVEHPDVITLGRGTQAASLPHDEAGLRAMGYDVFDTERGGDVTYHGPGQLVAYPILDLARLKPDLHWYLRQLEAVLIGALAAMGLQSKRVAGLTGVWIDGRKVASIGIHVKRWITFHGFALNVTTDLSRFDSIVPCGIDGVTMTSIANELGFTTAPSALWHEVVSAVIEQMGCTFERQTMMVGLDTLPQYGYRHLEHSHGCL